MNIGEAIKITRQKKGITQKELSKRTGIHNVNICDYENGRHKPSWENLGKIEKELETSLFFMMWNTIDRENKMVKNKYQFDINYEKLNELISLIFHTKKK